jgi:RNA polymerase sigma factor (sigma-70 family)
MSTINWQHIYQDYSPKLLGICRRYIQDIYIAEDIVQDSFITAIQKNSQLNDEKALLAWLKKIVVNNALQHIRKHSKDSFVATEPLEIPDPYSEMDHALSEEKNIFIYDFTREELLSSIDSLPSHHKSVFNLYFMEKHSHAEISGLLGITVNTSKSHLLRAKKSVQQYLLNNVLQQHTPKKKTAQLLVICGLGGLLWAQTFQHAFADFKISLSKKLELPPDTNEKTSIAPSDNSLIKKIIIITTLLLIILTSIFFLRPGSRFLNADHPAAFPGSGNTVAGNIKEDQSHSGKSIPGQEAMDRSNDQKIKKASSEDKEWDNKEETRMAGEKLHKQTLKKMIPGDSLEEVPQKVMVVKKIIKRDTIFVEK